MIPQIAIVEQYKEKQAYNYYFIVPEEIRPIEKKGKKKNDKRRVK